MKKLTVLTLALLTMSAFAQREENIKIDTFSNEYGDHSIHEVMGVEILEKVEGNRTCLNNETTCERTYLRDKLILKVSGKGEANFGGHNKVALAEKTLFDDYRSGNSIIELKFKGITENKDETLVYDNMAWASWGGSIPFEFKIELNNDLNKETEEKEFRIPTSRGEIYRFKVSYANEKWSVETLAPLASKVVVTGELAEKIFVAAKDEFRESDYAQADFSCLKAKGIETPVCFKLDWETSFPVEAEVSKAVFDVLNAGAGIFSSSYDVNIQCEKPNQWNQVSELTCSLSSK